MTVEEALKDVTKLGIDTSPLIYFVQSHPTYDRVVSAIFHQIAAGNIEAITSALTLTEILSWPIQQGNTQLLAQYRTLFTTSPHFTLVTIDAAVSTYTSCLLMNCCEVYKNFQRKSFLWIVYLQCLKIPLA